MSEARGPSFFIVGAAKSGTTSLWNYLGQHPGIFMTTDPRFKELGYYAPGAGVEDKDDYLMFFEDAKPHQLIGETCNAYLTHPQSAGLIKQAQPDARIIISLRNPADRAFSLFTWMKAHGYEELTNFQEALDAEADRMKDDTFAKKHPHQLIWNYLYFESGRYAPQIKRYYDTFGRENVHIVLIDDLKADALAVCRSCFEFLGVDPDFVPEFEVLNPASQPKSQKLQYFIRNKLPKIRQSLGLPKGMFSGAANKLMDMNKTAAKGERIDPETKKVLIDRYREDIAKTAELIGRDLSGWS